MAELLARLACCASSWAILFWSLVPLDIFTWPSFYINTLQSWRQNSQNRSWTIELGSILSFNYQKVQFNSWIIQMGPFSSLCLVGTPWWTSSSATSQLRVASRSEYTFYPWTNEYHVVWNAQFMAHVLCALNIGMVCHFKWTTTWWTHGYNSLRDSRGKIDISLWDATLNWLVADEAVQHKDKNGLICIV